MGGYGEPHRLTSNDRTAPSHQQYTAGSLHPQTTLNRWRPESGVKEDGRGSGLMVGLCGGADIFGLIIL